MDPVDATSFYAPAPPRNERTGAQPQSPPSGSPAVPSTPTVPSTPVSSAIPWTPSASTPVPSTQPRLRRPKQTQWQKADNIVKTITKEFRSLGAFLETLFHVRDFSFNDPRTASHEQMVTAFLEGLSNPGMGHILIYRHPQSRPTKANPESALYFSPPDVAETQNLNFAQPALSTWALQLVGPEMRKQIGILTQNDPDDPNDITQLRASTNGRAKHVRLATWNDLGRVSIPWIAGTYKRRARGVWYITECMGAPTVNGAIVVRERRPHPTIQVGVISSLTLSRNRYATGYLALPLAVWQFACKAHVDEKRIMSRFGFSVHDRTARACLDSLTDSSLSQLRQSVADGIAAGTMYWQLVLDNVQQYCRQRDHRIGREDVLKIGTAATAILLEDCAPGAFDLQDHLDRVMRQERRELTMESLFEDIDWPYIQELMALHWVRILVAFIPQLAHLRKEVSALFKTDKMTKRRLRQRKSIMQALMTNAERETETPGMMRAILDFSKQLGLDEEALEGLILMVRGDGASIAAMWRIKKFLAAHPSHYKAFRNLVPPGPEIWHTRWTQLNALATNYYGAAASADPSSLSKSSTAAGAKRPSNLKKVDFFPTSRSMQLFFEARVLDCWRILFEADDIIEYFDDSQTILPDAESLWESARVLVRRYASQDAYNHALKKELADSANDTMKIPRGTTWTPPINNSRRERVEEDNDDPDPEEDADGDPDFSGDRGLANEALFLQDMGWWVIAAHAVPEGEIGRVWEIMKVWILNFAGSSNHNYANYLLETYCLHRYEASKDFSDAMLNNWLVNPTGFKWLECDFAQEGYKKWLEEMVEHKGGDFDDHFYRHTLAPNVLHFLRMKDQMQSAFELKPRGKTHTLPHCRPEFQQLLRMHKEDELHLLRPGRTHGHAAVNFFEQGYERLEEGRIDNFIQQSTAYADIMVDVLNPENIPDETEEEFQERLEKMIAEASGEIPQPEDSDSDGETDSEVEEGDIGIHGMEYSDDDSDAEPEADGIQPIAREADEVLSAAESDDGAEELSELEEEQMDEFIIEQEED
ncbi:hypothetical protein C8R44DRAFT_957834 [Mycena epipterygia]|nr:hypothetical protein C8R44DRAFT_957834 [Mycena epipterygia]